MYQEELFPPPVCAFAFIVSLDDRGTWRVRAQRALEAAGFGPSEEYSELSLSECCDVICSELLR